jgi:hypothetical protein
VNTAQNIVDIRSRRKDPHPTEKGPVPPRRQKNSALRSRQYLTPKEMERLLKGPAGRLVTDDLALALYWLGPKIQFRPVFVARTPQPVNMPVRPIDVGAERALPHPGVAPGSRILQVQLRLEQRFRVVAPPMSAAVGFG